MRERYTPPGWVEPSLGEGISRPRASESTRLYRLEVRQPGQRLRQYISALALVGAGITTRISGVPGCKAEVVG